MMSASHANDLGDHWFEALSHANDLGDHWFEALSHANDLGDHWFEALSHANDLGDHWFEALSHANDLGDHWFEALSHADGPWIIGPRHSRVSVRRAITLRGFAKGAGAVVIGIIALDLVATLVTLAVGAEFLKR